MTVPQSPPTGKLILNTNYMGIPQNAEFLLWRYDLSSPKPSCPDKYELHQWEGPGEHKIIKKNGMMVEEYRADKKTEFVLCPNFYEYLAVMGRPSHTPELAEIHNFVVPLKTFIDYWGKWFLKSSSKQTLNL